MERSQLLDIDFAQSSTLSQAQKLFEQVKSGGLPQGRKPDEIIQAALDTEPQVKNVRQHNTDIDDVKLGAAPRTEAETKSASALLESVGLGWKALEYPLQARIEGDPKAGGFYHIDVPARKALVRSDTKTVIGDVGENYGVVQNETLAELADAVRGIDDAWTWGQGGALRGGARVFLQLRAPARTVGGEAIESNISLFNSFDGSLKFSAGFSSTVIVCKNTFLAAKQDSKNGLLLKHTSGIAQRIQTAITLLESAHEYTEAVDNGILSLMGRRFSNEQVEALVQTLVKGDSKRAENVRLSILDAYAKAPGAAVGTAWGAFQAVTNYATHSLNVRETSGRTEAEARVESSWWGAGAELTQNAWGILTDEEEVQKLQYVRVIRR